MNLDRVKLMPVDTAILAPYTQKGPSLYYVSKGTVWVGSEEFQKCADVI